jgi:hypothetical protein
MTKMTKKMLRPTASQPSRKTPADPESSLGRILAAQRKRHNDKRKKERKNRNKRIFGAKTRRMRKKQQDQSSAQLNAAVKLFDSIEDTIASKNPFLPAYEKLKSDKELLVCDIDGTLSEAYITEKVHRFIKVRPFATTFLRRLKPYYDIVLYSAAEDDRVSYLYRKFFEKFCIGAIGRSALIDEKKDLTALLEREFDIFQIDDNERFFCPHPKLTIKKISTYEGEFRDNELKKLYTELLERAKERRKRKNRSKEITGPPDLGGSEEHK